MHPVAQPGSAIGRKLCQPRRSAALRETAGHWLTREELPQVYVNSSVGQYVSSIADVVRISLNAASIAHNRRCRIPHREQMGVTTPHQN